MKQPEEGVIKFRFDHEPGAAPEESTTAPLRAWFRILRRLELVGQDPARYQGAAWGNLSRRLGSGFVVTCSQTSGRRALEADHFATVEKWWPERNRLRSRGPCPPSSESLTHAMLYDEIPRANWVFHAHTPLIWRRAEALGLPVTDPAAEYGTPEMADAVRAVVAGLGRPSSGLLSMGGHEDGVLAWGGRAEEAGCRLMEALAAALACG